MPRLPQSITRYSSGDHTAVPPRRATTGLVPLDHSLHSLRSGAADHSSPTKSTDFYLATSEHSDLATRGDPSHGHAQRSTPGRRPWLRYFGDLAWAALVADCRGSCHVEQRQTAWPGFVDGVAERARTVASSTAALPD
jgi:hypothetical protein